MLEGQNKILGLKSPWKTSKSLPGSEVKQANHADTLDARSSILMMYVKVLLFLDFFDIGLEAFCEDPVLVKMVESQTCGKIFAVEILDKSAVPLVILYDTSGDDDININAACLKALRDKSLELHVQVVPSSSCTSLINTLRKTG